MAPKKNEKSPKKQSESAVQKSIRNLNSPATIKLAIPVSRMGRRLSKKNELSLQEEMSFSKDVSEKQVAPGTKVKTAEVPELTVETRSRKKPNMITSTFFPVTEEKPEAEKPVTKVTKKAVNEQRATVNKTVTRKRALAKETEAADKPKRKCTVNKPPDVNRNLRNTRKSQGKELDISENHNKSVTEEDKKDKTINKRQLRSTVKDISKNCTNTTHKLKNSLVYVDKLPMSKLTSIVNQSSKVNKTIPNTQLINNPQIDRLSEESSSDESSGGCVLTQKASLDIELPSLNLSQSTNESAKFKNSVLDLLAQSRLEEINIPRNVKTELKPDIRTFILNVLGIERALLLTYEQLTRIFNEYNKSLEECDDQFVKPVVVCRKTKLASAESNKTVATPGTIMSDVTVASDIEEPHNVDISVVDDKSKVLVNDGYDDDALSLFAESITCIESSKVSVCEPVPDKRENEIAEYIPLPVTSKSPTTSKYEYHPSNIDCERTAKAVCEKQNADSTSLNHLNKEPDELNSIRDIGSLDNNTKYVSDMVSQSMASCVHKAPDVCATSPDPPLSCRSVSAANNQPSATPLIDKTGLLKNSRLFSDICIFNIMNQCVRSDCQFKHFEPNQFTVANKLNKLTDDLLVREYTYIKSSGPLIHKFGNCFVDEFIRRGLTRILLEVLISFHKAFDVNDGWKVSATESALSYLNHLDLESQVPPVEHMFLSKINANQRLCDFLIYVIAKTQNFTRFKRVFIYITYLISNNGGSFTLDVAEHLLERICILPCEKFLHYALVEIIAHTNADIFKNKMITNLENYLKTRDLQLFERLVSLKNQAYVVNSSQVVRRHFVDPPQMHINNDNDANVNFNEKERYSSPDTTNRDTVTSPVEPVIRRTIAFRQDIMRDKPIIANGEDRPMNAFGRWKQNTFHNTSNSLRGPRPLMSIPTGIKPPMAQRGQRPMMRPPMYKRQVSYRPNPNSMNNRYTPRNFNS